MNGTQATVIAKVVAFEDLNLRLFGLMLISAGTLLLVAGTARSRAAKANPASADMTRLPRAYMLPRG